MSSNFIKLLESRKSAEAVDVVVQALTTKTLAAINEERTAVGRSTYGRLCELKMGEDQPVFTNPTDNAYIDFFQKALERFGVKGLEDFDNDEQKKQFFDFIDKGWQSGAGNPAAGQNADAPASEPSLDKPTVTAPETSASGDNSPVGDDDMGHSSQTDVAEPKPSSPRPAADVDTDEDSDEDPSDDNDDSEQGDVDGDEDESDDDDDDSDFDDDDCFEVTPEDFFSDDDDSDDESDSDEDEDYGDDEDGASDEDEDQDDSDDDDESDSDEDEDEDEDEDDDSDEDKKPRQFREFVDREDALDESFITEATRAFHRQKRAINSNTNLTPSQKKAKMQSLKKKQSDFDHVKKALKQVKQSRHGVKKTLLATHKHIKRDGTKTAAQKLAAKRELAAIQKANKDHFKNIAKRLRALHTK